MSTHFCLAVAAPGFDGTSETFIRAHASRLAPGRTVLLSHRAAPRQISDGPILPHFRRKTGVLRKVWREGLEIFRLAGELGLSRPDRERVAAFLTTHGVKVVLAEYGWVGFELIGASHAAGADLYVHFHGYDATLLPRRQRWCRRYAQLFAAAAGIIAPSRYIAKHLESLGCPPTKLFVNPCGIEPDCFQPASREPGRVIAVGRLTEKKAPHLTLEAFARARAIVPYAHLDLVGDGELRARCEAMIAQRGLADAVTLHGVQPPPTVAALLSRASLFVQHSVRAPDGDMEGLPVSILEAMAAALPVVATRHSGIPEAVLDGETGLLVAEHDVDGMAAAMIALLTEPERAAAMGGAARHRTLTHFTQERTISHLKTIMSLKNSAQ